MTERGLFWWCSCVFVAVYRRAPVFGELRGSVGLVRRGDRFLLHHRGDGLGWDFPGGVGWPWENGEQTLRREVREETGLEVRSAEHLFTYSDHFYIPSRISVYAARAEGEPRGSWEGEAAWRRLEEVRADFFPPHRPILAYLDGDGPPLPPPAFST